MEAAWADDGPHAKFWRKLMNQRVDQLVNSQEWLKSLRFRWKELCWWQKRAGPILEERGINLYELVARAHGECWDAEDDEKNCAPSVGKEKPRQDALEVDYSRQVGVRGREKEKLQLHVRSGDEGREVDLQAWRLQDGRVSPRGPEKAAP